MINIFLLLISLFLIIYHCILKNWSYFKGQNVKFVRGLPIIGVMWKLIFRIEPTPMIMQSIYNSYPTEKIIGFYDLGGKPKYFLRDPEIIKQIFVKDFNYFMNHYWNIDHELFGKSLFFMRDQRWRNMRLIINSVFTGNKIRLKFTSINDISKEYSEQLKNVTAITDGYGTDYEMKDLLTRFVADCSAAYFFSININSLKEPENALYKTGLSMTENTLISQIKLFIINGMPQILLKLTNAKVINDSDAIFFRNMIKDIIAYRETTGIVQHDLVDTIRNVKREMLATANKERDDISNDSSKQLNTKSLQYWSDDDFIAQCISAFYVSLANVSKILCFLIHELTVNPDVQDRLLQEIIETKIKLNGKSLTVDNLKDMKYMEMVLLESMRKWTLIIYYERVCNKPYTLDLNNGTNIYFNVGDVLLTSTHGLHHDPKWFPDPNKFDPERFSEKNKMNIVNGSFIPFSIGPRYCMAARLSKIQCKLFIYHLLSNFKLETSSKTQHPIKIKIESSAAVDAEKGFWVNLVRRKE